jgi:hypothetical protein
VDVGTLLTLFSGALGAILSAAQLANARRSQEEAERALNDALGENVDQALEEADLKALGDYFFNTLGRLPLAEYAGDQEARSVVSNAVRNVETFVSSDWSSAKEETAPPVRAERSRIEGDAVRDFWGRLILLRQEIEISLRAAAEKAGVPFDRMGAGQLLSRLERAALIAPESAALLRRAIQICNRGVHGQSVSGEEVEEAQRLTEEGLRALRS